MSKTCYFFGEIDFITPDFDKIANKLENLINLGYNNFIFLLNNRFSSLCFVTAEIVATKHPINLHIYSFNIELEKDGEKCDALSTAPLRAEYNKIPKVCKRRFEQQILNESNAICYCFQHEKHEKTSHILQMAKQNNLSLFPVKLEQISN